MREERRVFVDDLCAGHEPGGAVAGDAGAVVETLETAGDGQTGDVDRAENVGRTVEGVGLGVVDARAEVEDDTGPVGDLAEMLLAKAEPVVL
jgi:hypothetical protein